MGNLKSRVESALGTFWDQNIIPIANEGGGSIEDSLLPLDSITACEVLVDLEEIVKVELPIGEIVQHGGYQTKDEFIAKITEAVMKHVGAVP